MFPRGKLSPDFTGYVTFYDGSNPIEKIDVPTGGLNQSFSVSTDTILVWVFDRYTAVYSGERCLNFDTSFDSIKMTDLDTITTVSVGAGPTTIAILWH